jgi:hypothetical protein
MQGDVIAFLFGALQRAADEGVAFDDIALGFERIDDRIEARVINATVWCAADLLNTCIATSISASVLNEVSCQFAICTYNLYRTKHQRKLSRRIFNV